MVGINSICSALRLQSKLARPASNKPNLVPGTEKRFPSSRISDTLAPPILSMKPPLLILISVLVPIVSLQESSGSTVYLGRAEGLLVTTDYQPSEALDQLDGGIPQGPTVLLGMAGDGSSVAGSQADQKTLRPPGGNTRVPHGGSSAGGDQWDRSLEASKLCNKALLHIKRDNFPQAIKVLDQAISVDMNHVRARLLRGVVAEKQGKHREAIRYYDSALALDPSDAEVYQSRGISHMELKNSDAAISDFTKALQLDPKFVEPYLKRGLLFGKLGRFEDSVADNTAAIAIDPENILAYNNRSAAYKALGKLDEARADIEMLKRLQRLRRQ
jgi:tetratricopeptide (TPR) repeat protein